MGAGPLSEAVLDAVAGPQQRGVAQPHRVVLVVDLRNDPDRAGLQLLLVGLDAQREPDQLGECRRARALLVLAEPAGEPLAEVGPAGHRCRRSRAGRRRCGPGDRVDDRGDHVVDQLPGRLVAAGEAAYAIGVVGARARPPGRAVGLEAPGRDDPQAQQRRARDEPDARVGLVARGRACEDRQRTTDRHRDRPAAPGELDDALAGTVGRAEGRGSGDGDEAQAGTPLGRPVGAGP